MPRSLTASAHSIALNDIDCAYTAPLPAGLTVPKTASLIEWRLYTPSSLSTNPAGGSASIAPQSLPKQLPLNQNGTFRRGFVKNKNQCVRSQRLIPRKLFEVHHIPTEILRSVSLRYFNIGSRNMHVRNRISIKKIDHRGLGYIKNRRRATRISAYVVGVLPCIWEKKPWPLMKGIDQPYHISTKKVNFFFRRV